MTNTWGDPSQLTIRAKLDQVEAERVRLSGRLREAERQLGLHRCALSIAAQERIDALGHGSEQHPETRAALVHGYLALAEEGRSARNG